MPILTPVVLVHGLWHGSWCWSALIEELAGRGVPAVAVDMDGHGLKSRSPRARWRRPFDRAAYAAEPSRVAAITATSAASTLVGQLRRIGGGRPCLLVAHSMAGVVATAAVEQAPELVAEVVYLSAFVPAGGQPAAHYIAAAENSGERVTGLLSADPAAVGALRLDPDDHNRHSQIRHAFYHDVADDVADAAISLLGPDGPAGIPGEAIAVSGERYGSVAHTYVVCTEDRAVPLALQRRFVAEIDAVSVRPTTVVELPTSHSPFLSRPAALADVLATVHRSHVAIPSR